MDQVESYTLYQQTRIQVARLHRAVERGACSTEAINFCRYLVNAGILRELKLASPGTAFIPIDGPLCEWEVSELLQHALSIPETSKLGSYEQTVLDQLSLIAAHVSKISVPVGAGPSTVGVSPETTTGTITASGRQPEVKPSKLP